MQWRMDRRLNSLCPSRNADVLDSWAAQANISPPTAMGQTHENWRSNVRKSPEFADSISRGSRDSLQMSVT